MIAAGRARPALVLRLGRAPTLPIRFSIAAAILPPRAQTAPTIQLLWAVRP